MAAQQLAHSAASRLLRAFHVSIRSPGFRLDYTAIASRSGDALADALALPQLVPPVVASVKPLCTPADALRSFPAKLALPDLVKGA